MRRFLLRQRLWLGLVVGTLLPRVHIDDRRVDYEVWVHLQQGRDPGKTAKGGRPEILIGEGHEVPA